MNDVLSYLSNVNNCWLKKKKKKIYAYIEQKWKSKIELNFSQWIYLFISFFFFCNKAKRENDIWTNELAEYYLTLLKENNNKKEKRIQIHNSFNVIFLYFPTIYRISSARSQIIFSNLIIFFNLRHYHFKFFISFDFSSKRTYAYFVRRVERKVAIDEKDWKNWFVPSADNFTDFSRIQLNDDRRLYIVHNPLLLE